jgi:hypothetical protein
MLGSNQLESEPLDLETANSRHCYARELSRSVVAAYILIVDPKEAVGPECPFRFCFCAYVVSFNDRVQHGVEGVVNPPSPALRTSDLVFARRPSLQKWLITIHRPTALEHFENG